METEKKGFFQNKIKNSLWLNFERNEIFLLLSFFFFGTAFANYEPYAPFWLLKLFKVESFFIIGLVVIIPSIAVALGTAFWGFLADKYGTKKFVIFGIAAYAFLFFSLIFTTSAEYFLVAVLIGSLMGAAQSSNFYALGTRTVNKPRSMVFAKMIASISLSWAIMSPFVGWINDFFQDGAMQVQLILAVVFCCISLGFSLFIKEKSSEEVDEEEINQTAVVKKKEVLTFVPLLLASILVVAYTYQITGGFWAYTSIYFLDTLNIGGVFFSIYLIIKTLLAVPIAVLLGRVKKHNTNTLFIMIFAGWTFFSYLLMMLFPMNWIMFLLIYSIPIYPIYNVTFYSVVAKFTTKKRRATAFGMMNALGTAGYVSGILILGIIADRFAKGIFVMLTVSVIFAVVALLTTVVFYFINRRKYHEETPENL